MPITHLWNTLIKFLAKFSLLNHKKTPLSVTNFFGFFYKLRTSNSGRTRKTYAKPMKKCIKIVTGCKANSMQYKNKISFYPMVLHRWVSSIRFRFPFLFVLFSFSFFFLSFFQVWEFFLMPEAIFRTTGTCNLMEYIEIRPMIRKNKKERKNNIQRLINLSEWVSFYYWYISY